MRGYPPFPSLPPVRAEQLGETKADHFSVSGGHHEQGWDPSTHCTLSELVLPPAASPCTIAIVLLAAIQENPCGDVCTMSGKGRFAGCGGGKACNGCLFQKRMSILVPCVANGGEKY